MIIEIPNFLSKESIEKIKNAVKPFVDLQRPFCFNRDGKTVNISKTKGLEEIDLLLHKHFINLNEQVIKHRYNTHGINTESSDYEYHIYNPGEIVHFHTDKEITFLYGDTVKNSSKIRYASVTVHLSTNENGGELVFTAQNKHIKTEEGKAVVFPPYGMFGHYSTPSDKPREVIICWFVYSDYEVFTKKP